VECGKHNENDVECEKHNENHIGGSAVIIYTKII